ncbi:MAG: hypothetical protein JXJ04_17485 [Spirochaetales bacterium]|nr:hypothetical protein [Spirochaetales bacterium]
MGCPFCKKDMVKIDLNIRMPHDMETGMDSDEIKKEMKNYFDDDIDIFSGSLLTCYSCGCEWKFTIKYCNIDPRDSSMGTDWYEIHGYVIKDKNK